MNSKVTSTEEWERAQLEVRGYGCDGFYTTHPSADDDTGDDRLCGALRGLPDELG